jgi:branched-chain amino acid transport system substrate-binding protein
MVSRRLFVQSGAASAAYLASGAWAANAPGVTDTEIKVGQTVPYGGPATAYGVVRRTEAAYFRMINEMGGVNGRKLNLINLDDGYTPPKTVEQTRRFIEQEQLAFVLGSGETPVNLAIPSFLNDNKAPQLFVGASMFGDTQHSPWMMGAIPNYRTEAHIFAKHILTTKPVARIGVIYQNDGLGKDYLIGLREILRAADHAAMVVKEIPYEISEPAIDSKVVSLQGSGADTFLIAAAPKFAAQAIRKAYDIGWAPARYLNHTASSIVATLKPAGLDKSKGLMTGVFVKDPTNPRWKDDQGYKDWSTFVTKYLTPSDRIDGNAVASFNISAMLIQVLKQCGDDLSRDSIMRQAANLKDLELPMLLPGIKINTSRDNYYPVRQMQLATFNGESWELFGGILSG